MFSRYPSSIIPKVHFRYRLPMRKMLVDYPDLAVVRRCKHNKPFVYSSSGKRKELRTDALESNLLEMSVNLLGGKFKMRHLPFNPKGELVKNEWDGNTISVVPIKEYEKIRPCGIIGFRVAEVNKFSFPYTKLIESEEEYNQIARNAVKIKEREQLDVKGEIVDVFGQAVNNMTNVNAWLHVNHHPNLLNYWHMQIDVYPIDSKEYIFYDNKSNEARRIRHRLREYISRIAICELGSCYHIGKMYYSYHTTFLNTLLDKVWNYICHKLFKFSHSAVHT